MLTIAEHLTRRQVNVTVVGCGGTGSAIAGGLPYLDQALLAYGHPGGLNVHLMDGDRVSKTNCVRQAFALSEIGHNKATVIATRTNLFWGQRWTATPAHATKSNIGNPDILIGCVDTRKARKTLARIAAAKHCYWLDIGNNADSGQFLFGGRGLPTAVQRWPELADEKLDGTDGPSCSAAEALEKQAPFVNQVLANHALAFLAQLFRYGQVDHVGGFVNLKTGTVRPIPA